MSIGKRIGESRKKKKWTQQELATQLFVTDKTVSSWELDRTEPDLATLVKLSEILEVSVPYLLYGNMEKSDIETEIKVQVSEEEFQTLENFIKEKATFIKENKQVDTYYQPLHRKFLKEEGQEIEEWLRIGIRGNKKILNYKNWYANKYCDEYEVEIDNEKNLDKILKILGLEEIAVVDKRRRTYFYLDKYEIAFDLVANLGYFIEIEVKNYSSSALEEYDQLLKMASHLGLNLNHIDKRGYPYHLIFRDI